MNPYSPPSTQDEMDRIPVPPELPPPSNHNYCPLEGIRVVGGPQPPLQPAAANTTVPPAPPQSSPYHLDASGVHYFGGDGGMIPNNSHGRANSATTTSSSSSPPRTTTTHISVNSGVPPYPVGGGAHSPPPYNPPTPSTDGGISPPHYQSAPPQYVSSPYVNIPDVVVAPPPSYQPPTRLPPPQHQQLQDPSIAVGSSNSLCPAGGRSESSNTAPPPYRHVSPITQQQLATSSSPIRAIIVTPSPSSVGFRPLPPSKKPISPPPQQQPQQQQHHVSPVVAAVSTHNTGSTTTSSSPTVSATIVPPSNAPVATGFRPLLPSKKPISPPPQQHQQLEVPPVVSATLPLAASMNIAAAAPPAPVTPQSTTSTPASTTTSIVSTGINIAPVSTAVPTPTQASTTSPTPQLVKTAAHVLSSSTSTAVPSVPPTTTTRTSTTVPNRATNNNNNNNNTVVSAAVGDVVTPQRTTPTLPALPNPTDGASLRSHEYKLEREVDERFGNSVARIFVPSHLPLQVTSLIDLVATYVMIGGPSVAVEIQARERNNPLFAFMMPPPPISSISLPPPTNNAVSEEDRWDRETESDKHWKRIVGVILKDPAVVYYRWRLYSLLNGDSCLEWRPAPFVMEAPSSLSSQHHKRSSRRGGDCDDDMDSRRGGGGGGGGRRDRSRSPPRTRTSAPLNTTLVWVPPVPVAPPGAASVFVDAVSLVPSSCFLTPLERSRIQKGGKSLDPTNYSRLFSPAEIVRHRRFSEHLTTTKSLPPTSSPSSDICWVYPRVEPWRVEHTSSIGWMSRQASQQQIPHVSVSSFPDPPTTTSQNPSSSSSFSHHLHYPLMDVDVDDSLEISILGGTRLRALGQAAPLEEPRCPFRLPSLLSAEDATVWRAMLDTKSLVKKRCNSLKPSSPPPTSSHHEHCAEVEESEGHQPAAPNMFEWSHVVDEYTFLLHDGFSADSVGEDGGVPSVIDTRDSFFITNVLHPSLLDTHTVMSPRAQFVLQHHRSPLHVVALILDEMVSLAHLPTSDVFLAIDAGVRDLQQQQQQQLHTSSASSSSSICSSLTINDLLRIKRRIIFTHQFGMLFCLFLLHEIVSLVQEYGGAAVLSFMWKHRPNQQPQQRGGGAVVDDGSQSAGSNDGCVDKSDNDGGGVLVPLMGIPASFIVQPPSANETPQQAAHTHATLPPLPRGSKRPREDDNDDDDGGVVPASHFAGLIRSVEMISTAMIEATMMLAGYDIPTTTAPTQPSPSSTASRVFAKLQQHQQQPRSVIGIYSGVIVQWLVSFVSGWYSDGVLALPSSSSPTHPNNNTTTPTTSPSQPSLHPLVGLTQRFAVQEKASISQVKYLNEALLNHPTMKILLPSQRRRVTLVEKYPYLF